MADTTSTSLDTFLQADPEKLAAPLRALWHDAHGNWTAAHEAAQADEQDLDSAWVHAYLHRKEGDAFNAGYWYRRVGKPVCRGPLQEEWSAIVQALSALG